ncbi:hypothetical protein DFH29DRAFT_914021 [Suillus ampliporus]|nr:hypothetical protein DFH29DRAFT_914021 [Suillus ampliporus]
MSFRRGSDQPSRASQPNRNFAPSSAYSQGLASQNAVLGSPISLRQPPLSIQISPSHSGGMRPFAMDASSGSRQGQLSTQETPLNTPPMVVLDMRDFSLALSIRAAQADGRECPWYGVWAKVLQNYIFRDADGSQTACTSIPQYSLVAAYDSGSSPETDTSDSWSAASRSASDMDMSPGRPGSYLPAPRFVPHNSTPNFFNPRSHELFGGPLPTLTPSPQPQVPRFVSDLESPTTQHVDRLRAHAKDAFTNASVGTRPLPQSSSSQTLPNVIPPSTPPRPTAGLSTARLRRSVRVPDFVQVLERTQQQYPAIPEAVIRRVIMTIEIKPEPKDHSKSIDWVGLWKEQVGEQVVHAFDADPTVQYLGVIMTYGCRWVYRIARRPPPDIRTMSERRDPTFPSTGPPEPWSVDSRREDWSPISKHTLPALECPPFVSDAKGGDSDMHEFHLLDAKRESLRVFREILRDLRYHNRDMWI